MITTWKFNFSYDGKDGKGSVWAFLILKGENLKRLILHVLLFVLFLHIKIMEQKY